MRVFIAITVLLSHWRRRPGQLATLIIGLSLATGLWTGVQAINTEARSSYADAQTSLLSHPYSTLVPATGNTMGVDTYVALQRAGWRTSPILEGALQIDGNTYRIIGIDPMTAPADLMTRVQRTQDSANPAISLADRIFAAPQTARQLESFDDSVQITAVADFTPDLLLTDIGVAARLMDREMQVSSLIVLQDQPLGQRPLIEVAPQVNLQAPQDSGDINRLTDSFHLNLTAFGLLSFGVGLFIVHGAIGLAFEQRRGMFRTMRVMGLSARTLMSALAAELLVFALLAGAIGVALGYFIAAALLPDVAATLRGLYGAQVSGVLVFRMEWWAGGIAIALLGTAIAGANSLWHIAQLPILASAQPRAWALYSIQRIILQALCSVALLCAALLLLVWGSGLVAGFAIVGALLVGAALMLPAFFVGFLAIGRCLSRGPLAEWFWADTSQQIPGLSLALMALLLALSVNIGVSTMVGSFRTTFTGWIDQRLASELYFVADNEAQAASMRDWLKSRADAVLPVWSIDAQLNGTSGKVFGVADHPTYRENWPVLSALPNAWDAVANGKAALINEQMSRRQKLLPGDIVSLPGGHELPIAGVYSDYGNPAPQAIISIERLTQWYPRVPRLRHAVRVHPDEAAALAASMRETFELGDRNIVDQATIKARSKQVFERTFAVTNALNILTLAVAGFAIFTSLLTLATMRLPQLAPVWALGMTRKKLAWLELIRALLLAALTTIVALPIGLAVAWLLLSVVNVEAFGWRLPMELFVGDWLRLSAFALIAACLAAALPARRMATISPAELVKVFTHER